VTTILPSEFFWQGPGGRQPDQSRRSGWRHPAPQSTFPFIRTSLAIRISGLSRHDGGYVDDPGQGRKDVDRAKRLWRPPRAALEYRAGVKLKLAAINQREQVTGPIRSPQDYRLNETIGDLEHGEQVAPAPTAITPNSTR